VLARHRRRAAVPRRAKRGGPRKTPPGGFETCFFPFPRGTVSRAGPTRGGGS
jgi:hypothetical protein